MNSSKLQRQESSSFSLLFFIIVWLVPIWVWSKKINSMGLGRFNWGHVHLSGAVRLVVTTWQEHFVPFLATGGHFFFAEANCILWAAKSVSSSVFSIFMVNPLNILGIMHKKIHFLNTHFANCVCITELNHFHMDFNSVMIYFWPFLLCFFIFRACITF